MWGLTPQMPHRNTGASPVTLSILAVAFPPPLPAIRTLPAEASRARNLKATTDYFLPGLGMTVF